MFGSLGLPELLVIFAIVVVVFGASRLPLASVEAPLSMRSKVACQKTRSRNSAAGNQRPSKDTTSELLKPLST